MNFQSKEEHKAALYDACLLIVDTYKHTDMLDAISIDKHFACRVSAYDFRCFAREVLNQIANGDSK